MIKKLSAYEKGFPHMELDQFWEVQNSQANWSLSHPSYNLGSSAVGTQGKSDRSHP